MVDPFTHLGAHRFFYAFAMPATRPDKLLEMRLCDIRLRFQIRAICWSDLVRGQPAYRGASFGRSEAKTLQLRIAHCEDPINDPASKCSPATAPYPTSNHNDRPVGDHRGGWRQDWRSSRAVDLSPGVRERTYADMRPLVLGNYCTLPVPSEDWHVEPDYRIDWSGHAALAGWGLTDTQGNADDVAELQEGLQRLDLYDGELDNAYGPLTTAAVADFQRINALFFGDPALDIVSGDWTTLERDLLRSQLTGKTLREDPVFRLDITAAQHLANAQNSIAAAQVLLGRNK